MTERKEQSNMTIGVLSLMACHFLFLGLYMSLRLLLFFQEPIVNPQLSELEQWMFASIFRIGLTQVFYGLPLLLLLCRRGRWDTAKGVVIGIVVTVLLNGSCFLLIPDILRVPLW